MATVFQSETEACLTTLCYAWVIERKDGEKLGFTDHDQEVSIGDTICSPMDGGDATEVEANIGFSGDTQEFVGALSSDRLSSADIRAGLYDGATIRQYLVNWKTRHKLRLLQRFYVGEIVERDGAFAVELRSLSSQFDQPSGRQYLRVCDASFGDARCGIDVNNLAFSRSGVIQQALNETRFFLSGIGDLTKGHFDFGKLQLADGASQQIVYAQMRNDALVDVVVERSFGQRPSVGSTVTLIAGCDKQFPTCRDRFANAINFRGFPHMPGNERLLNYLDDDTVYDASPLVP